MTAVRRVSAMCPAQPRVAAHRGGAALWPENSLRAVREAVRLGVALVEVDIHLTADGTPVVIHDPTLDRTTDARGAVVALTPAACLGVRLKGPDGAMTDEWLPTLDEVLAVLAPSRTDLFLELKGPGPAVLYDPDSSGVRVTPGARYEGLEAAALRALTAHAMADRTTILAFNPAVLAAVRDLRPVQPRMLLVSERRVEQTRSRPPEAVAWTTSAGATALGMEHTRVDGLVVDAARQAKISLGVWTVNDEMAMRRFGELGVDVITSDRPDVVLRVLAGG